MKRLLIALLLALPFVATAQTRAFDDFYEDYAGADGYRSVELGRPMMRMMASGAYPELAQLLENIRRIRIVAAARPAPFFWTRAREIASRGGYELISRTEDDGRSASFYFIDGSGKKLSELLMLSKNKQELVVLNICGEFDVRDISRLTRLKIGASE